MCGPWPGVARGGMGGQAVGHEGRHGEIGTLGAFRWPEADGAPVYGEPRDRLPPGRNEGGKARSVQGCGIQTGGWGAFLDEVWQDLEDLHGVGDHGDDLHGLVASRAAQWVGFIDFLDHARPASRRFLRNGCRPWGGAARFGRYGQLGLRLLGRADAEGWLGLMVALPPFGSEAHEVRLTRPPSRRARAPAGPGVPRAREEYRP